MGDLRPNSWRGEKTRIFKNGSRTKNHGNSLTHPLLHTQRVQRWIEPFTPQVLVSHGTYCRRSLRPAMAVHQMGGRSAKNSIRQRHAPAHASLIITQSYYVLWGQCPRRDPPPASSSPPASLEKNGRSAMKTSHKALEQAHATCNAERYRGILLEAIEKRLADKY